MKSGPHVISNVQPNRLFNRRDLLKRVGGSALALGASLALPEVGKADEDPKFFCVRNGHIQQSVIHWCFKPMEPMDLAVHAAAMGMKSVELVAPEYWRGLKELGLVCAMAPSHGFARKDEHEECLKILRQRIDECAVAKLPNVITFSGFRQGKSDEAGLKNMVSGLKQIAGQAEKKKVNVCIEVLNSQVQQSEI